MNYKHHATIPLRSAVLAVFYIVTKLIASAQAIPLGNIADPTDPSKLSKQSPNFQPFLLSYPAGRQILQESYRPIAPSESLRLFITSTAEPQHISGITLDKRD